MKKSTVYRKILLSAFVVALAAVTLLLVFVPVFSPVYDTSWDHPSTTSDFCLTITPRHLLVPMGTRAPVTLVFRNRGITTSYLAYEHFYWQTRYYAVDGRGRPVRLTRFGKSHTGPPPIRYGGHEYHVVAVRPGGEYLDKVNLAEIMDIAHSATYLIRAEAQFPIKGLHGPNFVLYSNSVTVTVLPPRRS